MSPETSAERARRRARPEPGSSTASRAESRELDASRALGARRPGGREEGWAARWWEPAAPRFAAASSAESLARGARRGRASPVAAAEPSRRGPTRRRRRRPRAGRRAAARRSSRSSRALVAAESRGEATLAELSAAARPRRASASSTRAGLDVAQERGVLDGVARRVGRRGGRGLRGRAMPFRWDGGARARGARPPALRRARRCPSRTGPRRSRAASGCSTRPSARRCSPRSRPSSRASRRRAGSARGALAGARISIADDASRRRALRRRGRRDAARRSSSRRARSPDGSTTCARRGAPERRSTGHGVRRSYRMPPRLGAAAPLLRDGAARRRRAELLAARHDGASSPRR